MTIVYLQPAPIYPVMSTSVPWSLVKSGFKKCPHFNTSIQKPAAGRGRSSVSFMPFATWDFELDLNYVQGGEAVQGSVLQSVLGCFLACRGGGNFFVFTDPNDSTVTQDAGVMLNVTPGAASPMGQTGDGVSTSFQLARAVDQGIDVLQNLTGAEVYVNGALAGGNLGRTGIYQFSAPPPAGAELSWDGAFSYLCQFADDSLKDLARVSKNSNGFLWTCSSIAFESVFV